MEADQNNPFIFFITLGDALPKAYYQFAQEFHARGFMLVPVKIDQLTALLSNSDQTQIVAIVSVSDSRELRSYNEKIRSLLKYVLKSKRLGLIVLSSFSMINDSKQYTLSRNYFFMKYPLDSAALAAKIVKYYELKEELGFRWPGGRKAGLGGVV